MLGSQRSSRSSNIQKAFTELLSWVRPGQEIQKFVVQSSLSSWCSLPKAMTTQDGKGHNQRRCGVLRSTEKFPDANLEEKACSESFPRWLTCYLKLHGLEKDSWQKRKREGRNIRKEGVTSSQRGWIQGTVNNLARGKGSPETSRKKEFQKREINGEREHNGEGFQSESDKIKYIF